MLTAPLSEPIRESKKVLFVNRIQHGHHRLLYDFILQGGDAKRALSAIGFGYEYPSRWFGSVRTGMNFPVQPVYPINESFLIVSPRHAVHSRRRVVAKRMEALHQ